MVNDTKDIKVVTLTTLVFMFVPKQKRYILGTTTKEDNGDNAKDTLDTAHIVLIVLLVVMFLIFGILICYWRKTKTSSWRRRAQFPKLNESRYMPLPKVSQYNSGKRAFTNIVVLLFCVIVQPSLSDVFP